MTPKVLVRFLAGISLGDALDRMLYRTRPYEVEPGARIKCSVIISMLVVR